MIRNPLRPAWLQRIHDRRSGRFEVVDLAARLQKRMQDDPMNDVDRERFFKEVSEPIYNSDGFKEVVSASVARLTRKTSP